MGDIIKVIGDWVWGPWMLIALFGTHVFLTFRLKGIQRYVIKGIRYTFHKPKNPGDISPFSSLMTALAATIGTGNLVGVATAVAAGGPGAVLWMWLTGVFGIATKYAEAFLAVKYRVQTPTGFQGGPMVVLERRLGKKGLAILFAVMTVVASFGIGNMVQSNSVAHMAQESFGIMPWMTGAFLAGVTGLVLIGGLKSIARICNTLVPTMAILYVLSCMVLLVLGWATLWDSLVLIVTSAFTGHAVVGGFLGAGLREAIRFGVARGLFSNESGMGSAPIVAAAARTPSPFHQALVSATGTFWDTVVICLMTGLVIVNSGLWTSGASGAALTSSVFQNFPIVGASVLTVALLLFVFSTILGWSYYGEQALSYLTKGRGVMAYRLVYSAMVFVGAVTALETVWGFADIANAFMVIPNLICIWLLSSELAKDTDAAISHLEDERRAVL
jgi:AGCS family alanine or glycine:cation symporter